MVSIEIRNRTHEFNLNFSGKFNFITGDSGDNKTHFISLCEKKLMGVRRVTGNFKIDNVNLHSDHISVYTNRTIMEENFYRNALKSRHNSLFIIDEFCTIFKIHDIASLFLQSDNYFIFVNRKVFGYLPVNVTAVYKLVKDKKYGNYVNKSIFQKSNITDFGKIDYILTEDAKSSCIFFERNFSSIEVCNSSAIIAGKKLSRDNSKLHEFLEKDLIQKDNILVVYDSAVYAPFMSSLLDVLRIAKLQNKNVQVLDWESFETYVLSLPMFNEHLTLENTKCNFNSLEQMSETRLTQLINYDKASLLSCLQINIKCETCKSFKNCKVKDNRKIDEIITSPLDTIIPSKELRKVNDSQETIHTNMEEMKAF